MSITNADITSRFPEFAGVATGTIDIYIADAALSINRAVFATKADIAHIYLTAHMLAKGAPDGTLGSGGNIKSSKVGDLSRTYSEGVSVADDGSFADTKYGREFIRIRAECIRTPLVINHSGLYTG